ncbi:MAG: hypothetical protein FJ290_32985 [Planctomycetes bacterium]|nr:hypothetical protein [Planctomycetota bacterium]
MRAILLLISLTSMAVAAELAVGEAVAIAPECVRDGSLVQATPAVAFGKKVYLIAWSDGSRMLGKETADIYCARVEPATGKALDPKGIVMCKAENLQSRPAIAFDGTSFLIAWEDLRNGTDHDIYAARVTEDGKVLDPDGFPVLKRPNNQAWPAVACARSGEPAVAHYIVAWMDARQYPVYGIYFARVTPEGKVLDPEGLPADVEDPAKIAKFKPPGDTWMGDKDYWWHNLASRVCPAAASNGTSVLLVYTKEYPFAGSGRPGLAAALVGGASLPREGVGGGSVPRVSQPVKVAGGPSPAWTGKGWALGGPAWQSGWTPTPFLGAAFVPETPVEAPSPRPSPQGRGSAEPGRESTEVDVVKLFGGGYNVGKGSTASFPSAAASNGRSTLVAMQYAWREKSGDKRPVFAILALRIPADALAGGTPVPPSEKGPGGTGAEKGDGGTGLRPVTIASATSPQSVGHPAIAVGPSGEYLLAYQSDSDVAKCLILARVVRSD